MPLLECENHHLFNGTKYGTKCPYCGLEVSAPGQEETEKSPAEQAEEQYIQEQNRVCGWLVCIKGPNKGRAYEFHTGKNFIGSGEMMDIRILGDSHIAKHSHAILLYEEKDRKTVLMPGESSGIAYCKGKAVYIPQDMEPFCVLELGDSQFVYAPLCGESFVWSDYSD